MPNRHMRPDLEIAWQLAASIKAIKEFTAIKKNS